MDLSDSRSILVIRSVFPLKSTSILLVDPRIIFPADKATFSAKLINSFFINSNLDGENYKGFYL